MRSSDENKSLKKSMYNMFISISKDAFLFLTIEVLLLTVRLFAYGGGTASQKDHMQFPDGGNRK